VPLQINDERYERITAGAPKPTDSFVRAILRDHYGVQAASCGPLAGETDHNTHVVDGTGAQYVLKVSGPQDRRAIEFQSALLRQLAEREPGLQVPRVVEDRSGALVTTVRDGDQDLVIRMLTWVSGTPLAEVRRRSAELLTDIGTTAGRLAVATAAFEHPGPTSPHYWHFAHAAPRWPARSPGSRVRTSARPSNGCVSGICRCSRRACHGCRRPSSIMISTSSTCWCAGTTTGTACPV
jgi:Ser/Thr protein kinase RdoA (MazF antagonist)